jgi:hypothetical protein
MKTIKDMPERSRPREKLRAGHHFLTSVMTAPKLYPI